MEIWRFDVKTRKNVKLRIIGEIAQKNPMF